MRKLTIAGLVLVLAACSAPDPEPTADPPETEAAATEPAEPDIEPDDETTDPETDPDDDPGDDDPFGGGGGDGGGAPGGTDIGTISLLSVVDETGDPTAPDLAAVLRDHGTAINDGRYGDAFALMSPALQTRMVDAEAWGRGVQSSIWLNVTVHAVGSTDPKSWADVTLRAWESRAGSEGLVCTLFDMRYTFEPDPAPAATAWLIDGAEARSITDCAD